MCWSDCTPAPVGTARSENGELEDGICRAHTLGKLASSSPAHVRQRRSGPTARMPHAGADVRVQKLDRSLLAGGADAGGWRWHRDATVAACTLGAAIVCGACAGVSSLRGADGVPALQRFGLGIAVEACAPLATAAAVVHATAYPVSRSRRLTRLFWAVTAATMVAMLAFEYLQLPLLASARAHGTSGGTPARGRALPILLGWGWPHAVYAALLRPLRTCAPMLPPLAVGVLLCARTSLSSAPAWLAHRAAGIVIAASCAVIALLLEQRLVSPEAFVVATLSMFGCMAVVARATAARHPRGVWHPLSEDASADTTAFLAPLQLLAALTVIIPFGVCALLSVASLAASLPAASLAASLHTAPLAALIAPRAPQASCGGSFRPPLTPRSGAPLSPSLPPWHPRSPSTFRA